MKALPTSVRGKRDPTRGPLRSQQSKKHSKAIAEPPLEQDLGRLRLHNKKNRAKPSQSPLWSSTWAGCVYMTRKKEQSHRRAPSGAGPGPTAFTRQEKQSKAIAEPPLEQDLGRLRLHDKKNRAKPSQSPLWSRTWADCVYTTRKTEQSHRRAPSGAGPGPTAFTRQEKQSKAIAEPPLEQDLGRLRLHDKKNRAKPSQSPLWSRTWADCVYTTRKTEQSHRRAPSGAGPGPTAFTRQEKQSKAIAEPPLEQHLGRLRLHNKKNRAKPSQSPLWSRTWADCVYTTRKTEQSHRRAPSGAGPGPTAFTRQEKQSKAIAEPPLEQDLGRLRLHDKKNRAKPSQSPLWSRTWADCVYTTRKTEQSHRRAPSGAGPGPTAFTRQEKQSKAIAEPPLEQDLGRLRLHDKKNRAKPSQSPLWSRTWADCVYTTRKTEQSHRRAPSGAAPGPAAFTQQEKQSKAIAEPPLEQHLGRLRLHNKKNRAKPSQSPLWSSTWAGCVYTTRKTEQSHRRAPSGAGPGPTAFTRQEKQSKAIAEPPLEQDLGRLRLHDKKNRAKPSQSPLWSRTWADCVYTTRKTEQSHRRAPSGAGPGPTAFTRQEKQSKAIAEPPLEQDLGRLRLHDKKNRAKPSQSPLWSRTWADCVYTTRKTEQSHRRAPSGAGPGPTAFTRQEKQSKAIAEPPLEQDLGRLRLHDKKNRAKPSQSPLWSSTWAGCVYTTRKTECSPVSQSPGLVFPSVPVPRVSVPQCPSPQG
ncbi:UNVERIFIED_CONTAM: hypothetical protein FKN15_029983 [Acipenser sinensis]